VDRHLQGVGARRGQQVVEIMLLKLDRPTTLEDKCIKVLRYMRDHSSSRGFNRLTTSGRSRQRQSAWTPSHAENDGLQHQAALVLFMAQTGARVMAAGRFPKSMRCS
jgi:hypothetical protein